MENRQVNPALDFCRRNPTHAALLFLMALMLPVTIFAMVKSLGSDNKDFPAQPIQDTFTVREGHWVRSSTVYLATRKDAVFRSIHDPGTNSDIYEIDYGGKTHVVFASQHGYSRAIVKLDEYPTPVPPVAAP